MTLASGIYSVKIFIRRKLLHDPSYVSQLIGRSYQLDGSTHKCEASQCGGGVGRNIAEALWRLRGGRTRLLAAVGDDADGAYLQNIAPGLLLDGCVVKSRTASYAAVFDRRGECLLGMGDMDIHDHITVDLIKKHLDTLKMAPLVVIDGNVPQTAMDYVLSLCQELDKPVFFEPTDKRKAIKALNGNHLITYASPNIVELRAMANFLEPNCSIMKTGDQREISQLCKITSKIIKMHLITIGHKGVVTVKRKNQQDNAFDVNIYTPSKIANVENVSGAGDCFASGFIFGILRGLAESESILLGFQTAKAALLSKKTVPTRFDGFHE